MTTAPRKLPAGKQAERPIIFSGPMVRAILDRTKTMTRREVKLTDGTSHCAPGMPEGDTYFFDGEGAAYRHADCPGCNPSGPAKGTPISELSGRPGHAGFEKFCDIAASWGYD